MRYVKIIVLILVNIYFNLNGQPSRFYIPQSIDAIKEVRVQFVYMQLEENTPGYPGNFTNSGDGGGPGIIRNGQEFADTVIYWANSSLELSQPFNLLEDAWEVIDSRIRFVQAHPPLYIQDNYYYHGDHDINFEVFPELDKEDVIIYIIIQHDSISTSFGGSSQPNITDNPIIHTSRLWDNYCRIPENAENVMDDVLWHIKKCAQTVTHELGHSTGRLNHVYNDIRIDFPLSCNSDIPTISQLAVINGFSDQQMEDSILHYGSSFQSNNLMQGSSINHVRFSISPNQIGYYSYFLCTERIDYWFKSNEIRGNVLLNNTSASLINRPYPILANNITVNPGMPLQAGKPTVLLASNKIVFNKNVTINIQNTGTFYARHHDFPTMLKSEKNSDSEGSYCEIPTISIYPNPSDGTFTIISSKNGLIKIYSVTNDLVFEKMLDFGSVHVDLSAMNSGIYIVQFIEDKQISSTKIIIE